MWSTTLLLLAMATAGPGGAHGVGDYQRSLTADGLNQADLDAEGYGDKEALKREDEGLRITSPPGSAETGWRTPPQLLFGGDFTVSAELLIKKLPRPALEDGAAVGLAIAFGDVNQPDATLIRLVEPSGDEVYRIIDKSETAQIQSPNPPNQARVIQGGVAVIAGGQRPGGQPANPPRRTFPAVGESVRLELHREGQIIRYQVVDANSEAPRYLGQTTAQGSMDVAAVKLFVVNRNGDEVVDVLLKGLTIRAEKLQGLGAVVRTIYKETIYAEPTAIEDGALILGDRPQNSAAPSQPPAAHTPEAGQEASQPKTVVPLDELESIHFERSSTLTGRFVGQPNLDFTMPAPDESKDESAGKLQTEDKPIEGIAAPPPGTTITRAGKVAPKKNGIRDIQLSLFGLRPSPIKQMMVSCQTDEGATTWQLDASGPTNWPLVIQRAGIEVTADLFLEPPPGDCHEKNFTVSVTYEDGQSASANFQADGHSDAKLAVDPDAPAFSAPDARVFLADDETLFGKLERLDGDALTLTTPWKDRFKIPLDRVLGVHLAPAGRKESPESFASRLKSPVAEDLLLAQTENGEVLAVSGILEAIEGDRLRFLHQGKSRTLPLARVEGLLLASRPEPAPEGLRVLFSLPGDVTIAGAWREIKADGWTVETSWGQRLKLPPSEIRSVRFQGGKMTHLSDLKPSKVEETPFFGRRFPWRRDVGLTGGPLKINGRTHERGLAVHSRSELTYDLDGRYETFQVLIGFDDEARGLGRVDCRIFADDKELYANPDFRADEPPVALKLSVAGASQLRLLVDFGPDQDVGDRLIWADARLHREGSMDQ